MSVIFESLPFLNYLIILTTLAAIYFSWPFIAIAFLGLIFISQFEPSFVVICAYIAISAIFILPSLRKNTVTKAIIFAIKKLNLLPKISETEKTALKSGTVWVDGELFSGKPNFKKIFGEKYAKLSVEERKFLGEETEELCKICCDEQTYQNGDLSKEVWKFLKEKKFFGMIIPKKYGGLGFSACAHSAIIQKLSSRSVPLAITAMVPNSLGPAELLLHYGTKEQQDHYLPRLAEGKDVPCFALTETEAGSDATSITSNGVLFKDEDRQIKIKLNWSKRYITLGAYATVIGLAFQLKDPENLLGDKKDIGITCALIPYKTKGVKQGRRHDPLSTPFVNSPIDGKDVIVDLDVIIGGKNGAGKGWKMLMECLAAGRGVSLPSTSTGGAKMVSRVTTAYVNVRQQFGLPIGKFEAIEAVMARIISKTYQLDAMRCFTAAAVDSGAKPAVVSAIAKYHSTEMFRQIINDGMDILGGSAIIRGKRNLLANAYFSVPISITVEGANIMTRSLIHFGQGAIMCHPFVYKEFEALENNDIEAFDKALFGHIAHFAQNKLRSLLLSLSRGYLHKPFSSGLAAKYERKLAWASANFAFFADIAIIKFGGNLKRKEKINSRFGDILSAMYMAVCVLRRFEEDGKKPEDEAVVKYALAQIFVDMQNAFDALWPNLFSSKLMKIWTWPCAFFGKINQFAKPLSDDEEGKMVQQYLKSGKARNELTKDIYVPQDKKEALGRLENAFDLFEKSGELISRIKKAIKSKKIANQDILEALPEALEKNIINKKEAKLIKDAKNAMVDAVKVDDYSLKDYKNAR